MTALRQAVQDFHDRVRNRRADVDRVTEALAEHRCTILDLVTEGDRAFARMHSEGIRRGTFVGFAPTGRRIDRAGAALFALKGGENADPWQRPALTNGPSNHILWT